MGTSKSAIVDQYLATYISETVYCARHGHGDYEMLTKTRIVILSNGANSTFRVVLYISVTGEYTDFEFYTQVEHSKSQHTDDESFRRGGRGVANILCLLSSP